MNLSKRMSLSEAFWFQEGPGIRNWQFTDSGVKLLNVANILPDGTIDLSNTTTRVSSRGSAL
jgi:type I restriction enzyme S subunit